jgi:hypothetical protein
MLDLLNIEKKENKNRRRNNYNKKIQIDHARISLCLIEKTRNIVLLVRMYFYVLFMIIRQIP